MADQPNTPAEGAADAPVAKAPKPIVPILAGVVGGALVSFAVCQFVLIPKIKKAAMGEGAPLAAAEAPAHGEEHGEAKKEEGHGGGGHGGKEEDKNAPKATKTSEGWSYPFPAVTANLSGSLGRQYLKCTIQVVSDDKSIATVIEENKGKLKDAVLSVLSSRSLADVESPSAKTVLKAELVANLNKALGSSVIKQVQFTDFLIQ